MGRREKTYDKIMRGNSDRNINFEDLCNMLDWLGFSGRIKGDHFIYYKDGIPEILNLQPIGNKAKPYQIKQIRYYLKKYEIGDELDV